MSENIIIALITSSGALLGGIIGALINAYATIKVAGIKVQQTPSQALNQVKEQGVHWAWPIIGGAMIGAVITLSGLAFMGLTPEWSTPNSSSLNENPDIASIVGKWRGTAAVDYDTAMPVLVTIEESCKIGSLCGAIDLPALECTMRLRLESVANGIFTFSREKWLGECSGNGGDTLQLRNENQILWAPTLGNASGILRKVN